MIRWHHPELGSVAPLRFIQLAEETGLIIPIGEWVLKTACAQTSAWHRAGYRLTVAVNVSGRQFQQKKTCRSWCSRFSTAQAWTPLISNWS
ncbi:EAL domain-containing protein [Undibacterium arcticum]